MNRRKFLSHSAVALSAGPAVLGAARSSANRPACNYRIVYNDDGHTLQRVSGIQELLVKGVDRFIGTQVDALFWSIGEADVYYFSTRTAERYGENVKRFRSAGSLRFVRGLESVLKEREDYFQAMADRCRQIGILFFVTVRMNDAHDSPKGWNAVDLYSQFKKAHPELLLERPSIPVSPLGSISPTSRYGRTSSRSSKRSSRTTTWMGSSWISCGIRPFSSRRRPIATAT